MKRTSVVLAALTAVVLVSCQTTGSDKAPTESSGPASEPICVCGEPEANLPSFDLPLREAARGVVALLIQGDRQKRRGMS